MEIIGLLIAGTLFFLFIEIADEAWKALALKIKDDKEDKEDEALDLVEDRVSEILEETNSTTSTERPEDSG